MSERFQAIIGVCDQMGFYYNFDKIFVKDKVVMEKIDIFLKENSYISMGFPNYEDIYFDKKMTGGLAVYEYKKSVFQKEFEGISDEMDAFIKTHIRMKGITFSIIKVGIYDAKNFC